MKLELDIEIPDVVFSPVVTKVECGNSHVYARFYTTPESWIVTSEASSVGTIRAQPKPNEPAWTAEQALAVAKAYVRTEERSRLFRIALADQLNLIDQEDKEIPS